MNYKLTADEMTMPVQVKTWSDAARQAALSARRHESSDETNRRLYNNRFQNHIAKTEVDRIDAMTGRGRNKETTEALTMSRRALLSSEQSPFNKLTAYNHRDSARAHVAAQYGSSGDLQAAHMRAANIHQRIHDDIINHIGAVSL